MASIRGEIHTNELKRFKEWLKSHGWIAEETRGFYEKLRVRKDKEIMIFYKRDRSAHLSCSLESLYVYWVSKYRTEVRKKKLI